MYNVIRINQMENMKTAKEIKTMFGITSQTLYNWRKNNTIKYIALNKRNYLYYPDSVNGVPTEQTQRINVVYGRVSNTKQKTDLETQLQTLIQYANNNGHKIDKTIQDIASGMNENRTGFNELLDLIISYKINIVFITFKDRLTRFGFDYLQKWFSLYNTKIIVINDDSVNNFDQELTQDLISIIHHFSMKMYSNRRKMLKKVMKDLEEVV